MSVYDFGKLLLHHRDCVNDAGRINCYRQAIFEVVRKGDIVADVGTGTGILAILACRAGARKVYAIEPDSIIDTGPAISAAEGFRENISFLCGSSYDVTPPEKVDVLIAGNVHNFGLEFGLLSGTIDARRRFLKPEAVIIPSAVELFAVPVELKNKYDRLVDCWNGAPAGIDYSSVRERAVNSAYKVDLQEADFLARPDRLTRIELNQIDNSYVSGSCSFIANRSGVCHGLGGWCRAELSKSATLSTAPGSRNNEWDQIFFPITEAVPINESDRLTCSVDTNDGRVWRWQMEIETRDSAGNLQIRRFRQSTFFAQPLSPEKLRNRLPHYIPKLSEKGEEALFLLSLCDGRRTVSELQQVLSARYSFPSPEGLAAFVAGTLNAWGA